MKQLIESIKLTNSRKKTIKCIPLPIGSYLKAKPKEMRFGRQETLKSETTSEGQNIGGDSFRNFNRVTERKKYKPLEVIE